jgi:hypothetical protein
MAVIKRYFPGWGGPGHFEISPRWWIYWLNFGHRVGCAQFTSDTEELLSCEKAGPSFPSAIPDNGVYDQILAPRMARERVRNYSIETLDRLVPRPVVVHDVHGIHTTQIADGLTQESYIPHDGSGFEEDDLDIYSDVNTDEQLRPDENVPFGRSLEVPLAQKTGSARDSLKPYYEELFLCLDRLNDSGQLARIGKQMEENVGLLREMIANSTLKRRVQMENVSTVHVCTETRGDNPKRVFASHLVVGSVNKKSKK